MNDAMDQTLVDWLRDGPERGPQEGLERSLAATRRVSQRPGWTLPERWIPMETTLSRAPSARPVLTVLAIVLLVVALVAAAVVVGSRPRSLPAPFGPAADGAVVFAQEGDLFVADGLEGPARVLVGGPTEDRAPTFSRQGDAIAFLRSDATGGVRLMRVDPDGSHVQELAGPYPSIEGAAWSPDGRQLLVSYTDDQARLAIVAADGSSRQDLALPGAADYGSWRPDGRTIAFRGWSPDEVGPDLFLAAANGSDVRGLHLADVADPDDFFGFSWSPDGAHLAYERFGDLGWQVTTLDVDASGAVTGNHDLRLIPGTTTEMLPLWSPDSRSFAFIAEKDGQRQVAIAPADGSGTARPVGPSHGATQAGFWSDWSPDGRTLLISVIPRTGDQTLWAVDVATGQATPVVDRSVDLPTWQRIAP